MNGLLIAIVTCVISFALARWLSRGWRARRAERQQQAALATQSRQVRRAAARRQRHR